jgi:thiol-disulfide isomerase/thioredoxin
MPLYHLTSQEQFEQLLLSHPKFLVWFSAAWCGPCQRMDKAALIAAAEAAKLPFYYCDHTVNPATIDANAITSFPTFVVFENGQRLSIRQSVEVFKVCQYIAKA